MTKLRVFLVDDHVVVREGLKALVNAQPGMEVIGEAGDGRTACAQISCQMPDVVVLDVSMPGMSGSEAAERLTQQCPQVKVLALTVHEDKGYLRQLLEAGAAGYILKRAAAEELIRAIRTVAEGGVYFYCIGSKSGAMYFAARPWGFFVFSRNEPGAAATRASEIVSPRKTGGRHGVAPNARHSLVRWPYARPFSLGYGIKRVTPADSSMMAGRRMSGR